jgi:hypothetical protein
VLSPHLSAFSLEGSRHVCWRCVLACRVRVGARDRPLCCTRAWLRMGIELGSRLAGRLQGSEAMLGGLRGFSSPRAGPGIALQPRPTSRENKWGFGALGPTKFQIRMQKVQVSVHICLHSRPSWLGCFNVSREASQVGEARSCYDGWLLGPMLSEGINALKRAEGYRALARLVRRIRWLSLFSTSFLLSALPPRIVVSTFRVAWADSTFTEAHPPHFHSYPLADLRPQSHLRRRALRHRCAYDTTGREGQTTAGTPGPSRRPQARRLRCPHPGGKHRAPWAFAATRQPPVQSRGPPGTRGCKGLLHLFEGRG